MKRLFLLMLVVATPLHAAERQYQVTDFDRVRVEGPIEVHLATRGTPAARVVGQVAAAASIEIRVEGRTLTVRTALSDSDEPARAISPTRPTGSPRVAPVVYLRTTDLRGASVVAGGKLELTGPVRGARVDLQVAGSGSIVAPEIAAEHLIATLLGNGTLTLGGRSASVRMIASGAGTIDATALQVDALLVRVEGPGTTRARARYTADVVSTGLGAVTIAGSPKCKVKAPAGGSVVCGTGKPNAE